MADRLTIKEKYKVQQILDSDEPKTIAEISEELGKSEGCINKYIEDGLIPLLKKINKARQQTEDTVVEEVFLTQAIKDEAVNLLVAAHIPERVAQKFIEDQIEPNLTGKIEDANILYKICINKLTIHTAMVQKTAGGKEGVTISTQAASQIAEEAPKPPARVYQPHIFRPKD